MSLKRRVFVVSRGLEYFSESELQMQIGVGMEGWPAAILKELIDNALDACEAAEVQPVVEVEVTDAGFWVRDNGSGIPSHIIDQSLDYHVRVSDKLSFVTPTRGRLGNALKVLWAAPYVATGSSRFTVHACGVRHEIGVKLDRIGQKPVIEHQVFPDGARPGTEICVSWPDSASLLDAAANASFYKTAPTARELVEAFAAFNPHANFRLNGDTIPATVPDWKKWQPGDRLVPHWYKPETFRELVANYVASESYGAEPITVREFISSFRGLSATKKQKAITDGFKREYLHDLVTEGDLDADSLATLLRRMKELSQPPKPYLLGVIGKEHLTGWMVGRAGVAEGSIKYRKRTGVEDDLPYVIEVAFGVSEDDTASRRIVTGLNWSPTFDVPAGEIRQMLQQMRVDPHDPVVVVIHMATPEWKYTGRGKEKVEL